MCNSVNVTDLSESDLALLHGLQIAPRVTWTAAAELLDTSASRLAERWRRLRAAGLAWATAYPAPVAAQPVIGFTEIELRPGDRAATIRRLCADPRVASVEESARGNIITIFARDLDELTRLVLEDLAGIPGIIRYRAYLATAIHQHGSSWRLDALDRSQRQAFEAIAAQSQAEPGVTPPPHAGPLMKELSLDGRASAADLARRTGRQPATIRRQLPRLLASGVLTFRCEVSQAASHWPLSCTYFARVPSPEHERTASALRTLPELRQCIATTGETNLMFTVWVRSPQALFSLEATLGKRMPWLQIVDNSVSLRTHKRMGWLLDARGRASEFVPLSVVPED